MTITDLTDTHLKFTCYLTEDKFLSEWQYDLDITAGDETYYHNLSIDELLQLRDNCKRILGATNNIQGGN